jgi:hypothetical protein
MLVAWKTFNVGATWFTRFFGCTGWMCGWVVKYGDDDVYGVVVVQ